MATITASLVVNSDITDYGISINKTMTLTKAGTNSGLERTSGVQRVYLTDTNQVDLIKPLLDGTPLADMTRDKAAKVYIKYLSDDTSKFITIGFGTAGAGTPTANSSANVECFELGRLYGNEWMIIPCSAISDDGDIVAYPSTATAADEAIVEYIVFFE
tara:strand:+ start:12 stop:488 length:477 start_codon:yes stop_codon:yes gene_type:complete